MRVLMIHGRAQGGKNAQELEATWVNTLQEGFREARKAWSGTLEFDFPYYGDKLDELTAQAKLPTPADVVQKGTGQNTQFEEFMQSALDEMQQRARIPEADVRAEMDPGGSQQKGPQNWGWVQAIARVIDKRLERTTDFTIENFLSDVFLYVTRPAITRQINEVIEEALTAEPTIVIAHSLGTVVAYNVLKKHQARLALRKFITVGSPLGIRAISSKLGVPENPAATVGWYNAYDERDIVALNPLDDDYFPTDPAIVNNNAVRNDTRNRHGIVGYLNDKNVAAEVAAAMG